MSRTVGWLSVWTLRWGVDTAEEGGRGVVAPVLVRVSGLVVSGRAVCGGFPAEAKLVRCFVVVGEAHELVEPVSVEVVVVAFVVLVVGSVVVAVVVAVPGWCTTVASVVGVRTSGDRWVVGAVGVVSFLAAVRDVPRIPLVVLEHDVHSVRDEVVLAGG